MSNLMKEVMGGVAAPIDSSASTDNLVTYTSPTSEPIQLPPFTTQSIIIQPWTNDLRQDPTLNYITPVNGQNNTQFMFNLNMNNDECFLIQETELKLIFTANLATGYTANSKTVADLGLYAPKFTSGGNTWYAGSEMIADFGGWFSTQIVNITIQIGQTTLPPITPPFVAQMGYCNSVLIGRHFQEGYSEKYVSASQGKKGAMTSRDLMIMRTKLGSFTNTTLWGTDTATGYIFANWPLYPFLYSFLEPGFMEGNTLMTVIFQFQTPTPSINVTMVNTGCAGPTTAVPYVSDINYGTSTTTYACTQTQVFSAPITLTLNNMAIGIKKFFMQPWMQAAVMKLNVSRPLSFQFPEVTTIVDQTYQNYAIPTDNSSLWGTVAQRQTIRGSGTLGNLIICCPIVTSTWTNAWGVSGFTWTRTALVPGLLYINRLFLANQEWERDQYVSSYYAQLATNLGFFLNAQDEHYRRALQIPNYMNVADTLGRKGYGLAMTNPLLYGGLYAAGKDFTSPTIYTQAMKYYEQMTACINTRFLSHDTSLETINYARSQQLEYEGIFAPSFTTALGASANNLLPFAFSDVVLSSTTNDVTGTSIAALTRPALSAPSSARLTIFWIMPYNDEWTCGMGRFAAYRQLVSFTPGLQQIPT